MYIIRVYLYYVLILARELNMITHSDRRFSSEFGFGLVHI